MSVLKAHEIEPFLRGLETGRAGRQGGGEQGRRASALPFCLMAFGPDRGLVSEAVARFCAVTPIDSSDALGVTVLDGPTVAGDPGRLWDELNGPGLFGDGRLVRLREVGGDKRLAEVIRAVLDDPPESVFLAIEGGDLKRTSALVKAFDGAKGAVALPCYADDARTLAATLERMLDDASMSIDEDARAALLQTLGGDRRTTLAEIEKLVLYSHGTDRITLDDVRAVTGDAAAQSADLVVDAALTGDRTALERHYARLLSARASPFLVLRDLAQQLQWVERAQAEAGGAGRPAAQRVSSLAGRRVHFRRMPALERAASSIAPRDVRALGERTVRTILASRLQPSLEAELVAQLCQEIATLAR